MINGVKPVKKDRRDRSFPRTFGGVFTFPDELNLDAGFGFPDQNKDGLPNGCTGYAQTEICQDQDKAKYQPRYTYDKTRVMEGTYPNPAPCEMRDSLNSTIVYGILGENETTDTQAGTHRRGAYYAVEPVGNDWFDAVRSALFTNNRSVSVATPWFSEWEGHLNLGIVPFPLSKPSAYHNWKVCGWKNVQGSTVLIGKSWQGPEYGDGGYHYISRETFNAVMKMDGTGAFTLKKATQDDYQTIKLSMLNQVLSYLRMLLKGLL